jgi:hypothetical protein
MWNASGKDTILLLFLDSQFKKYRDKCETLPLETKQTGDKLYSARRILFLSAN